MSERNWGDEIMALTHQDLENGVHEQIADAVMGRIAALEAKLSKMEVALKWYGEKAEAMKRYAEAKPPKTTSMTAVVTELSLDGGNRAEALAGSDDPVRVKD